MHFDPNLLRDWLDLATEILPDDRNGIIASLHFIENQPNELRLLIKKLEEESRQEEFFWVYTLYLLNKLEPSDTNFTNAFTSLNASTDRSHISDPQRALIKIYRTEIGLYKLTNSRTLKFRDTRKLYAYLALKREMPNLINDTRMSMDLLHYPVLFGWAYELTGQYYDYLSLEANPVVRIANEITRDRAFEIASQFR